VHLGSERGPARKSSTPGAETGGEKYACRV
jgi:hypothetical protein